MSKLSVPDMSCGHCKASIEAALAAIGAQKVSVDLAQREVSAEADPAQMIAALARIGFPASPASAG